MRSRAEIVDALLRLLDEEIQERRGLINQMVGSLYPSVLVDEVADIRDLQAEVWKLRK